MTESPAVDCQETGICSEPKAHIEYGITFTLRMSFSAINSMINYMWLQFYRTKFHSLLIRHKNQWVYSHTNAHEIVCITSTTNTYTNDLPKKTKNEMRFSGLQVLRTNIDNIAANCLWRR